ncbi:TraB/GumN family protein [Devosia sp. FKR38]|uniref:TraB/GumN family protein n=1 Tax=Devosia sp. FKR38 TaxID=2562312 RepID=UPI0010C0865C|nr:TraB/GumN family protein [Devosia sp. FKR38]
MLKRLLTTLSLMALGVPAQAAPALWEIRDGDSAVQIFGSLHVMPADTDWRTPLFDETLAEADQVVFETDVRPMAMAEVSAKAFVRGIYVDGTQLTDVVDAPLADALRAQAEQVGVPFGPMLAMRPWMAANTLSAAAMVRLGLVEQGVEFVLEPEISAERLAFLETGDEQIEVLAGAPDDEQIALLQATVDEFDQLPKVLSKLLSHWLGGTPDKLGPLFLMEMGGFEGRYLERLLLARNRNWIPPIEQMLADNRNNLIIVGAGHLVGEGSVIELLEAAGYSVERIQ